MKGLGDDLEDGLSRLVGRSRRREESPTRRERLPERGWPEEHPTDRASVRRARRWGAEAGGWGS